MSKYAAYAAIALVLALGTPCFSAPDGAGRTAKAAGTSTNASFVPDSNMSRSQIPDRYKWNLSALFESEADFEDALVKTKEGIESIISYRGKLDDSDALYSCMQAYFDTRRLANSVTLYSNLRLTTDLRNAKLQDMDARAQAAMRSFMANTAFIRDELLKIDSSVIDKAATDHASMQEFLPWITGVRRRQAHILSPEEERILSLAGDNQLAEIDLNELPSDFEKAFQSLYSDIKLPVIQDENGRDVQLTFSNYGKYRASKDRRVRKDTVEKFFGALNDYRNTFASLMAGQVRFSSFLAQSRGYDSALQAYLDKDNIPEQVYRNVVDTVKDNTKPLHRYISLRKKVMGLQDIHLYDLYTPLVPAVSRDIPYEEACRIIPKALAPLGEDYVKSLTYGLDLNNGWVDVYPHADKDSGASCASIYGCHPFVKLNYMNSFNDMSTVAHEFGHAMHSNLNYAKQSYSNAGYVPFVAEVASTCNEKFLSDYLIANAKDDAERLYLINEMLDAIRSTIYRQALFADFEMRIHEASEKGQTLTADFLNKTYADLIREYYGAEFTIDANDGIEWAYIPHLYYKFYVFSYAAGMSSGIAIADKVHNEGEPARKAYLDMLSSSSATPPVDILKIAGVDLTKPDAVKSAADLMDKLLDEMEAILVKQHKIKK
ncbi:MAG: oligoendopeptidase F [Candidatus Bruticola sp.]